MDHLPMLLQAVSICLADSVEDDCDAHDGESIEDPQCKVLIGDGLENRLT
jgi:hypothetical protein